MHSGASDETVGASALAAQGEADAVSPMSNKPGKRWVTRYRRKVERNMERNNNRRRNRQGAAA